MTQHHLFSDLSPSHTLRVSKVDELILITEMSDGTDLETVAVYPDQIPALIKTLKMMSKESQA